MVLALQYLDGRLRGCKKMQKKCKKMQNYLHISKKSSIFAAELGIVPSATIKYNRVMKKEILCKVSADGVIYRLERVCWTGRGGGYTYRVYRARKRAVEIDFPTWHTALSYMMGMVEVRVEDLDWRTKQ